MVIFLVDGLKVRALEALLVIFDPGLSPPWVSHHSLPCTVTLGTGCYGLWCLEIPCPLVYGCFGQWGWRMGEECWDALSQPTAAWLRSGRAASSCDCSFYGRISLLSGVLSLLTLTGSFSLCKVIGQISKETAITRSPFRPMTHTPQSDFFAVSLMCVHYIHSHWDLSTFE